MAYITFKFRQRPNRAGRFEKETVEETYEDVIVSELIADAQSAKVPVAGASEKIERRIKVADSRFEWQPVLCETNTTDDIILRLQSALSDAGYSPGSIDGVLGRGTLIWCNAVKVVLLVFQDTLVHPVRDPVAEHPTKTPQGTRSSGAPPNGRHRV